MYSGDCQNGELLIDIAEMDDIAAIALMSLFFAMIPVLNGDVEANIFPVFMERGRQLGDWAVSPQIFTSMILVSVITCIISPLLLRPLLQETNQ